MTQAKDIPDATILRIVREFNEGRASPNGRRWCLTYDLEERLPDIPPKVILAKCRGLIKRGLLSGCPCGCRGDFYIPGLW